MKENIDVVPIKTEIIPFGKYKDQPIEAMAQDGKYVEWLTSQDWFRDKYKDIYSIVINNFQAPSETPDHPHRRRAATPSRGRQ